MVRLILTQDPGMKYPESDPLIYSFCCRFQALGFSNPGPYLRDLTRNPHEIEESCTEDEPLLEVSVVALGLWAFLFIFVSSR